MGYVFADAADDQGKLLLSLQFGCEIGGQTLAVGEKLNDCYCDVDGALRDNSGALCE